VTTRITVTADSGGLLDRNAQQQAAARQAALLKAQAEKAAASGEAQLRQDRINAGLDPATGRPLPSTGSTLGRVDQQPAAIRRRPPALGYVLEPSTDAEGDIWVVTKPRDPLVTLKEGFIAQPVIYEGDGPGGTNSLGPVVDQNIGDGLISDPSYRRTLSSAGDPPGLTDTVVPGWLPYNPGIATPHPLRRCKSFTLEFYFRLGDNIVLQSGPSVRVEMPGVSIVCQRGEDALTGYVSFFEVSLGGIVPTSISDGIIREGFEYWRLRGGVNPTYDIAIPQFGNGWNHTAVVKNGNEALITLNGRTIASGTFYSDYYDRYTYLQEDLVPYYSKLGDLFPAIRFWVDDRQTNRDCRIHGLRWTPKALYGSSPFTPPDFITLPA
jgi:hypothetical protein